MPPWVVITPVPLVYAMTLAPESEEEEILLLKLVQSAVERQPKVAEEAVLQVRAPAVEESPVPMDERRVPLREMSRAERPFTVLVAETKRFVVDAVPVVVELVTERFVPVMLPVAETLEALMFEPVMLPALMAPPKEEVLFPVTWRFVVVAVPLTMRFDDDAVPLTKRLVA